MVRHIVLWTLKDELSEAEKTEAALKIKKQLESLCGKIQGLKQCQVYTDKLDSSDADIMLDSFFTDRPSLENYQTHPDHIVVKKYVSEVVSSRKCIDLRLDG